MAATSAVLNLLSAGDHVVVGEDLYGGTYRLFARRVRALRRRLHVRRHDRRSGRARRDPPRDEDALGRRRPRIRCSISSIIAAIAALQARGRLLRRRQHVRDAVLAVAAARSAPTSSSTRRRSTSAGTATSSAAPTVTNDADHRARRSSSTKTRSAACPGRSTAWLDDARRQDAGRAHARARAQRARGRGVPRARGPTSSASTIRAWPSHPQHELAKRQMRGFGGMVSFTLRGPGERDVRVCQAAALIQPSGEPRRRRVAHLPSGAHDARFDPARKSASGAASPTRCSGCRSASRRVDDLSADLRAALDATLPRAQRSSGRPGRARR